MSGRYLYFLRPASEVDRDDDGPSGWLPQRAPANLIGNLDWASEIAHASVAVPGIQARQRRAIELQNPNGHSRATASGDHVVTGSWPSIARPAVIEGRAPDDAAKLRILQRYERLARPPVVKNEQRYVIHVDELDGGSCGRTPVLALRKIPWPALYAHFVNADEFDVGQS